MTVIFRVEGKMSTFGGPDDHGVKEDEGLSLFSSAQDMANHGIGDFLLGPEEAGATGLARRLDPDRSYLACRWWDSGLKKQFLKKSWAWVENPKTGEKVRARPVDSGPAYWTNRVADLSPGLARRLNLETDDVCSVTIYDEATEFGAEFDQPAESLTIHGTAEWGAAAPKLSYFPRGKPAGIVIHNTEGRNRAPADNPEREIRLAFKDARQIQHSHMNERGWSDTGQHFTISQGGVITEGRHGSVDAAKAGQLVRGAHCRGKNDEWWGIELAGDNRESFVVTGAQWQALVALCAWLTRLAGEPLEFQPHNHFNDTTCPGTIVDQMDRLRSEVREALQSQRA